MNIQDLNTGSGSGFHKAMMLFALTKFGPNPNKSSKDKTSWNPTADTYANGLLDHFVGVTTNGYGNMAARIFLRALLARELGMYLLTNHKTPGLYESVKRMDKMYWAAGCSGSLQTKALPAYT